MINHLIAILTVCRGKIKLICLGCILTLVASRTGLAQNSTLEFWPESDIWYRLSPAWRLSMFIPVTKYNESKYRDLNVIVQADYGWGESAKPIFRKLMDENRENKIKVWLARGGYMGGWSLGENKGSYLEDMLFAEIHKRIPLKGKALLSQRIRLDTRWLGEDNTFSYRFRYRLMIEKEYSRGNFYYIPYLNIEPYWDSRYQTISRVRLIAGTTMSWGSRFAWEANITYQYDEHYNATNLFALNLIMHVFFERNYMKAQ